MVLRLERCLLDFGISEVAPNFKIKEQSFTFSQIFLLASLLEIYYYSIMLLTCPLPIVGIHQLSWSIYSMFRRS